MNDSFQVGIMLMILVFLAMAVWMVIETYRRKL